MSALSDLLNEANVEGWSTRAIQDRATAAGHSLGHDTAAKWLRGEHPRKPSEAKLRAWNAVFPKLTMSKLRAAAKVPTLTEVRLPEEVARLSPRQAQALQELILSMIYPEGRAGLDQEEAVTNGTPIAKPKRATKTPADRGAGKAAAKVRARRKQDTETKQSPDAEDSGTSGRTA